MEILCHEHLRMDVDNQFILQSLRLGLEKQRSINSANIVDEYLEVDSWTFNLLKHLIHFSNILYLLEIMSCSLYINGWILRQYLLLCWVKFLLWSRYQKQVESAFCKLMSQLLPYSVRTSRYKNIGLLGIFLPIPLNQSLIIIFLDCCRIQIIKVILETIWDQGIANFVQANQENSSFHIWNDLEPHFIKVDFE